MLLLVDRLNGVFMLSLPFAFSQLLNVERIRARGAFEPATAA
jgi:hypothetical protein